MSSNIKELNFLGQSCPVPVIETRKIIEAAKHGDEFKVIVGSTNGRDNVSKMLTAIKVSDFRVKEAQVGFEIHIKK
ncbi:sulfurtransferase TusA family protein [Spiroplasma alleghenense]|uniref:UPF0033 domain-containing protein n=1 Tax=Spiroplasma alleghenense TaxID=216931 RepID=A0A345Z2P1_9MOLU|nr:sulfurtransferase TusA family protein [Spiroplasma alleghenense]AXK50870.1 hypothetical protein SALLE_v1c01940 [Spiroplasma alleghenense]